MEILLIKLSLKEGVFFQGLKMIKIIKINKYKRLVNEYYIGRNFGNLEGSVLGNKFKINRDGDRKEVIEKYRKWLWKEVKKKEGKVWNELMMLVKEVKAGKDIYLSCWCKPLECHGDVIKSCIEWLIKEGH